MKHSISTINADVAQAEFGARGEGIVWAIIGSGVESGHVHFQKYQNLVLPDGLSHWDITNVREKIGHELFYSEDISLLEYADSISLPSDTERLGHGTSVAALIAGEHTLDCNGLLLRSMAPKCKIMSLRTHTKRDKITIEEFEFNILAALNIVQEINNGGDKLRIHGVILPLQLPWEHRNFACGYSPVCVLADRLSNSGVVVVTPAGNMGFDSHRGQLLGSITDPGNAPNAITVGSTHRLMPNIFGASFFSSKGPTADGRLKPDLLAPGENIITCIAGEDAQDQQDQVGERDGTAYAAAHVAGAIASLLSVRPELIGRPLEVKELLMRTALDLGRERVYQGAGLIDLVAALRDRKGAAPEERPKRIKVFISYSHNDKPLWEEFHTHLSPMERTGLISVWSDQAIPAGTEWEPQIWNKLEQSDLVLLLVSSYFVSSDYCYSKEMTRALERHKQGGVVRVVPILVRPVDVQGTPIADLQMLPPEKKAVTTFPDPHQGWAEVSRKLREIVLSLPGD